MDIIGDYFSPNYEQTTANEKIDRERIETEIADLKMTLNLL